LSMTLTLASNHLPFGNPVFVLNSTAIVVTRGAPSE
jgi:hypothetical protein